MAKIYGGQANGATPSNPSGPEVEEYDVD